MRPGIEQTFWSDREIEEQDATVKLTLLWLITNSQTSWLGVCTPSLARFQFETGLPAEALEKTLRALPNTVVRVGEAIFLKNYIRHQFGTGEKLIRNNFFLGLKPRFAAIKDQDLQAAIVAQCPELNEALTTPSEGLTKPKRREDKNRAEKKECRGGEA